MLTCRPGNAFVCHQPKYPRAVSFKTISHKRKLPVGRLKAQPISVIQIDDPNNPGEK
ncbi:DUF2511 domain-containing protein [Escherichia coli]